MSTRNVFSTIFVLAQLAMTVAMADAQGTEQAAREQASSAVRSELHSRVGFKSDQFLSIDRNQELEETLAMVTVGWRSGPVFIYRVSPTGIEVKEHSIVNHVATDANSMYIVAVSSADEKAYRIHGFGLAESVAELERLITALKVRLGSPEQAEALGDFYRKVNPENYEAVTPITRLIELKQAAERQCHSGVKSFDAGEKAFAAWWNRAKPLYAAVPLQQRAIPHGNGYRVEWIVLSSPSNNNCGGAPLRATLEVSSDGHLSKVTLSQLQESPRPSTTR